MGVSSGSVVILSLTQKRNPRLLQIPDALQFQPPSALALSPDEEVVVVGHNDGALGFYETSSGKLIKFSREVHKFPILMLKFYNLDGKHMKESRLITSDAGFKTCKVIFKKGIFSYDVDSFQLIPESRSILQVEVVESSITKCEGGRRGGGGEEDDREGEEDQGENLRGRIIALASEKDVMIIEIEPKARRIISFPPPPEGGFPSISWNNGVGKREKKAEEAGRKNEELIRKENDENVIIKKGKEKDVEAKEKMNEKKETEEKDDDDKIDEADNEEVNENDKNEEDNDNKEKNRNRSGLYLMIGWGFHVYIVKVYITDQKVNAKLMGVFKVQSQLIYISFLTENLCLLFFEGKVQIINIYDLPEFREIKVEDLDKDEFYLKKVGSIGTHSLKVNSEEDKIKESHELNPKSQEERQINEEERQFNEELKERSAYQREIVEFGVVQEEEEEEEEDQFSELELIPESNLIDFGYNLYYTLMVKEIKTSLAVNCYNLSFNRRFSEKTLYFIHEKVSISRLTVLSWESYMSKIASTLPWQDTLKVLLQIYQGFNHIIFHVKMLP